MTEEGFAFAAAGGNDWGDCAAEYARLSSQMRLYAEITDRLIDLIDPEIQSLVDFGCGDGRMTRAFLRRASSLGHAPRRVFLVDKFREMLALTDDLSAARTHFIRVCDSELLDELPGDLDGTLDVVACNSSFFLCRNVDAFVGRIRQLLRAGGTLVANVPDQDFSFEDGWRSRFRQAADRLWKDPAPGVRDRFSHALLYRLASHHAFDIECDELTCTLPWQDFIRFYSIPFMGARRMPGTTQEERVRFLESLTPLFSEIPYRWVFFVMRKNS